MPTPFANDEDDINLKLCSRSNKHLTGNLEIRSSDVFIKGTCPQSPFVEIATVIDLSDYIGFTSFKGQSRVDQQMQQSNKQRSWSLARKPDNLGSFVISMAMGICRTLCVLVALISSKCLQKITKVYNVV